MSRAAEELLQSNRRIIDIAFAAGYESQESFSRAFKAQFLLSPDLFRRVEELGTSFSEALGVVQIPPDGEEALHYLACIEAESELPLPSGFQAFDLSAGRYAVFEHRGDAKLLDHTVNYIYSHWLLNSDYHPTGAPDVELYGARYNPDSDDSDDSVVLYAVPVSL